MSEVCFYLKDRNSTIPTPIYLQYKYSGQRLKYYCGQSIKPDHWSFSKQRVKSNKTTTTDGQHSLNELLDNLQEVLLISYRRLSANGIPTRDALRKELDAFVYQNSDTAEDEKQTLITLIDRFVSGEIQFKGRDKSKNTIKTYGTVKGHLIAFAKKYNYPVTFDTINLDFFYKYMQYLGAVGLAQNTKAKHIQVIKVFMNEALDQGLTANMQHKHRKFTASWEESEAVYLTQKELITLYRHNLTSNKKLESARDLSVFGSFVGLRFSDYSAIRPEHIKREFHRTR